MSLRSALFAMLVVIAGPALAVEPSEMLADPAAEARAREISQHLRCVVCQNQTIDDSNADLAHDMRLLVRERVAAGDSDQEVIDYVVARYGNFVLLRPPFQANTWALWGAPFAVLALAIAALLARQRVQHAAKPLTDDERRQLDRRLGRASDSTDDGDA
jgi:cytochrome c-type biogenesis protein CcmH